MNKFFFAGIIFLMPICVWAGSGEVKSSVDVLNVRENPSVNAKVLFGLSKSDSLKILKYVDEYSRIDCIESKWCSVLVNGSKQGWVFAGFLSAQNSTPYSYKDILGQWYILGNDGDGETSFIFREHGELEIKGNGNEVFDDKCVWGYNNIEDVIEIKFSKERWCKELKDLKKNLDIVADGKMYVAIDPEKMTLRIKINRNNIGRLSFTFIGYNVNKDPRK